MRMPYFVFTGMLAALAAFSESEAATACSKATAEELSHAMQAAYPDGWLKMENAQFPYRFPYPSQMVAVGEPAQARMLFDVDWCGHAAQASEPLKMEVHTVPSKFYQRKRDQITKNGSSAEYLSKAIFPSIAPNHSSSGSITCNNAALPLTTISSKNGDMNYLRQLFTVENEGNTYEFAFNYSVSEKPEDKARDDAFIKDNNAIECAIVSHVTFVPPAAAPAK